MGKYILLSESSVSNTVHVSIYDTHANMNFELVYHILVKPIRVHICLFGCKAFCILRKTTKIGHFVIQHKSPLKVN